MKDKKIKNGIEEIRKMGMTPLEKKLMLRHVLSSNIVKESRESSFVSFISLLKRNRFSYYAVISCLCIILGSGIVFASEDSLPDSILYPIKVGILEPVRATLTFKEKAKAEYQSKLATERLVEAETLANKGTLNPSKEKKINKLLENHTKALDNALGKVREKETDETVDDLVTNFDEKMNKHAQNLDDINKYKNKDERNQDTQISKSAREKAKNIRKSYPKGEDSNNKKF